jgi:hypothetical protein
VDEQAYLALISGAIVNQLRQHENFDRRTRFHVLLR